MARFWYAVTVAILYAIASEPGQALLIPNVFVAPIRLSAGVAIAALILTPTRNWWLVILALVPRHVWVGDPANHYSVAMQYFAANSAEALLVAFILRSLLGSRPRLDDLRSCVIFLFAGVIFGPVLGATIGAPVIVSRDLTINAFQTWEIWAFADGVGNLVVVPLALALPEVVTRLRARVVMLRPALVRIAEGVIVFGGLFLTIAPGLGQAALGRRPGTLSMLYAPFPLLIWASIRFGPGGAASANAMLTLVTVLYALTSRAPFGEPWAANSVIETQQFLIVALGTSITLAALVGERWRAQAAEREATEQMRIAMRSARIGSWSMEFATERFIVSDELASLIGLEEPAVAALAESVNALNDLIHPEDQEHVQRDLAGFRAGDTRERSQLFRAVRPDGTPEWIKVRRPPEENGDVSGELRVLRPDGVVVWVESHGRILFNADGLPERAIGMVLDISQRKELQAERERTTQALMRLARSSVADRGEIEEALREITATAAETLGVERVGVWLLSGDLAVSRCVCEYDRTSGQYSSGAELSVNAFREYFNAVTGGRTLAVEDTLTDERTRELVDVHRGRGIRSRLDAPVYIGGKTAGALCFVHVGEPREWSLPARNFAASMSDLLSRAFEAADRHKAEAEVQRAYLQLRNLARRLEAAKEDERREIARELHDELGQSVTAIVIGLNLVSIEDREGRHAKRLKDTVALAERLIERVRAISLNLRPPLLDELGLITALRGLVDVQAQQSGLRIVFAADGIDERLSPELEINAFRIVQECLTNVMRHAAASEVNVRIAAAADQLSIEVWDDGRGFNVAEVAEAGARGRHLGLVGMQERVTVLGGHVAIVSTPGKGTRISASLPLQVVVS